MKLPLLFATTSLVVAAPYGFAKTELEMLRERCQEQERQIRQMEEERSHLASAAEARPKTKPVETVSSVVSAPERKPAAAGGHTYKVKPGDSFAKIARKLGTTPELLARTNGLETKSVILPGQELKVPGKIESTKQAASEQNRTKSASSVASATPSGKIHTLQQGETFTSISRKYGISTAQLIAANPSLKPTALRPGQQVKLMAGTPSPAATTTVSTPAPQTKKAIEKSPAQPATPAATASRPSPKPEPKTEKIAETKAAPPEPEAKKETAPAAEKKISPVIVDGEITYGEFAAKHGTDAARLNSLNGLDLTTATVLAKGSELYVPAQP